MLQAGNADVGGQLPNGTSNLPALQVLNLVGCGFSGSLPSTWSLLPSLTTVRLDSNW